MLSWFMYWSVTQWQRHATTTIHGNHNDTLHGNGNRCEYYHDGNGNTCIPAGTIYHDTTRHDTTATVAVCIPAGTSNDTLHATRYTLHATSNRNRVYMSAAYMATATATTATATVAMWQNTTIRGDFYSINRTKITIPLQKEKGIPVT